MAKAPITQEFVRDLFDYIESGKLVWKRTNRGRKQGKIAGCFNNRNGYRQIAISGYGAPAEHRLVFLWHHGYMPNQVDHINMDKVDNRIENLRASDPSLNQRNVPVRGFTKSKLKGVHWDKSRGKFMSRIKINGKHIFLGRFSDPMEAYEARKKAQHIHGSHGYLPEVVML